jgi:ATP-dependent exoDNAse (exonuclease V) beta subunit
MSKSVQSESPLTAKAPFLVLDASAGSGKTYTLVQHILMSALKRPKTEYAYQKILAITFTNNAADEMKTRLLEHLLVFSKSDEPQKDPFFRPIWEALELDANELQSRAASTAKHMLHNYSTLNVGTIDQFTHRLVRTFTKDLNLEDNFEVRLDLEAMVAEALEGLYSSLGDHSDLKKAMVTLVHERMARVENYNPDYHLKKEGKDSFQEDNWQYLEKLPPPERLISVEVELKRQIHAISIEGKALSNEARTLIKEQGLDGSIVHFNPVKKHILEYWQNLRKHPLNAVDNLWKSHVKKNGQVWEDFLNKAKRFESENKRKLMALKLAAVKLQRLAAIKALLQKFDDLQKSQNTMPLSSFNKLIYKELDNEPAGFIYARLGEKYWHFYIDEFQDTSQIQFTNLHPLIEHTLTKDEFKNSALIVGDAKQSIYRWRGGKAEQFIDLVNNEHPINKAGGFEQYKRETLRLKNNYRTYGAIVDFNNNLFASMSSELRLERHQNVYLSDRVSQSAIKENDFGEVKIDVLEARDAADFKELACEKTLQRIKEIRQRGFDFSDVAILVRGNADGKLIANYLTNKGCPVFTSDGLILGNSHEGRLLHAASKMYLNPDDKQSRFALAHALVRQKKVPKEDGFILEKNTTEFGASALIEHFPKASKLLRPSDSLFDFAVRTFDVFGYLDTPNAAVDSALDAVYAYQSREGAFANFPVWWKEEAANKPIQTHANTQAVRVMTVHKSKGLEFEHVIVPFDINYKKDDSEHWIEFPYHDEIERMPVKFTKENLDLFEKEQILELETKSRFDWMNMVYVALTRPICGLHIILKEAKEPKNLSKAVFNQLGTEGAAGQYVVGKAVPHHDKKEDAPQLDKKLPKTTIGEVTLKMSLSAPNNWQNGGIDVRKWGTAMHRILQGPKEKRRQSLERLYRSGVFSAALSERAHHILDQIVAHKALNLVGKPGVAVYTERSLINGEHFFRPDLIIESEQQLMVIDYKTGTPKAKDEHQLNEYIDLLSAGFENVEGELLYI